MLIVSQNISKKKIGCLCDGTIDPKVKKVYPYEKSTASLSPRIVQSLYPHCTSLIYWRSCVGCGNVVGMYAPFNTTQDMKLVAVVVHILQCAVSSRWSMFKVLPSHLTPIGWRIQTNLYWFGVNTGNKCYSLTNNLTNPHGLLTTLVELTTSNQVGDGSRTLGVQSVKEIIFTINTKWLRCDGECHRFQIGEGGENTATSEMSLLVYLITSKLYADLKNYTTKLCMTLTL
jgi:hypothetical protein